MKFRIGQQIEEVIDAIERLPIIEGRLVKKSAVEYRQARLRAALATLRWVEEHEPELKAWVEMKKSERLCVDVQNG